MRKWIRTSRETPLGVFSYAPRQPIEGEQWRGVGGLGVELSTMGRVHFPRQHRTTWGSF